MSISLTTDRAFRDVWRLPFCYLCGLSFGSSDDKNRDHVPASGLFALADRDTPLILPVHRQCNGLRSPEDQAIGQLVGVLHGRRINQAHNKLRIRTGRLPDGRLVPAVTGLDIKEAIRRWVRGFHAALYREYLPWTPSSIFATYPPLPEGRPVGVHVEYVRIPEALPKLVEELKRNRAVGNLDRVVCRNSKCRYECVWSQADDGRWICIYGLDLYNWINLGADTQPARGCVGCYRRPSGGVPPNASTATRLVFDVGRALSFDPFEENN